MAKLYIDGALVTTFDTITTTGDITAGDDLHATDDLTVGDDAEITDDLTVGGDLDLNGDLIMATGKKATTDAGVSFTILPGAGGITQIGDAGSTSRGLNTNDDAFIAGKLETDGVLYANGGVMIADDLGFSGVDAANFGALVFRQSGQTPDTSMFCVGATSNHVVIVQYADHYVYDFAHTQTPDPTVYLHSANQSTTECIYWTHNRTDGVIGTLGGNLSLNPAANIQIQSDLELNEQYILVDWNLSVDHTGTGEKQSVTVDANGSGIAAALYMAADGNYEEADASAEATMPCSAIALEAGTGTKEVLTRGPMRDDTWNWTPGGLIWVSATTGDFTQAALSTGEFKQLVGFAVTADIMYFNPSYILVEIP